MDGLQTIQEDQIKIGISIKRSRLSLLTLKFNNTFVYETIKYLKTKYILHIACKSCIYVNISGERRP